MASIAIRKVDEGLKRRLRTRAAAHGRSMSAEVRAALRSALGLDTRERARPPVAEDFPPSEGQGLGTAIHERFKGLNLRIVDPPGRRGRNEALIFLTDEDCDRSDAAKELEGEKTGDASMGSLTIRNLDDEVKRRLRVRAAERGRSMEQEVRDILWASVHGTGPASDLYAAIRACVEPLGGLELVRPPMEEVKEPPAIE